MNKIRGFRRILQFENRWLLLLTRLFFKRESLSVYRFRGAEILSDHLRGDANGAREVLTTSMYRQYLPLMKLDQQASVLDLGGSNGGFPLLLLTSGLPLKKVVSVEFNPNTFIRLHFNLHRNLPCETVTINAALCGTSRTLELQPGLGGVSDSIYEEVKPGAGRLFQIQGITFDEIYENNFRGQIVDICKIDVEGAEFEVLLNPHHENLRKCRYLLIEIHEYSGRRAEEILPVIESLGFRKIVVDPTEDSWVHFFSNSEL